MARFAGVVGFNLGTQEIRPGVWEEQIVEKPYFGDVVRASRQVESGDSVNGEISVSNSIEIVADAFASENFFAIRYINWAGTNWSVPEVEIRRPRLVCRLGGVYDGPTAGTSDDS